MTIAEVMKQAQALSAQERKELVKLLIDSLDVDNEVPATMTGAKIAVLLGEMEPIALVDPEITDPVAWVKTQRRKEMARLRTTLDGER